MANAKTDKLKRKRVTATSGKELSALYLIGLVYYKVGSAAGVTQIREFLFFRMKEHLQSSRKETAAGFDLPLYLLRKTIMDLPLPSVLTQLPRPLQASTGKTQVGEVYSLADSKKRKRYEIAVAVDGEGLNIYNVRKIPFLRRVLGSLI